jgi:hypothetical protein
VIAARIPRETLETLKAAAARNRRSLSGEIAARLDFSVGKYRKGQKRDDLALHISRLLDLVAFIAPIFERSAGQRWHLNRFTGQELAKAIGYGMARLSPDADDVIPPKVIATAKTHSAGKAYLTHFGESEAEGILAWFEHAEDERSLYEKLGQPVPEWLIEFCKIKRDLRRRSK